MWILYAVGSAFFAGVTSILAKSGIKKTDSNVATAIRTIVVFIFSWIMVFVVGSQAWHSARPPSPAVRKQYSVPQASADPRKKSPAPEAVTSK